ncbi:MAG TPA: NAD-dependent succinate-semialdehyde dehydrogenase [Thermoanaerobaculia bacterium]|nr:NAD-dependent succinate-semialdehyde dehydrogenase [Thermoanaerobaculia bacterium]
MAIESRNPATGEVLREYPEMDAAAVDAVLESCHAAFLSWRQRPIHERAALMARAADVLDSNREPYSRLMVEEMGKPIRQARAEVEKCAWCCRHYAEEGPGLLAPRDVATDAARSFVAYEPLGVVLAVMPWNFPFWQVFRFAAPNLVAGNAGVLKHASNVPRCALAIEQVFAEAGFPEDVFRTLLIGSGRVSAVLEDWRVRAVTVTGSTSAGRAIGSKAGELLKKAVLELGGSDPYLVLADADLDAAVASCVASRLVNGGQSCIAAKRFIVDRRVARPFEERMAARMARTRMGDPMAEDTELGPLARHDLRDDVHSQVVRSVESGARLLLGGAIAEGRGAFYPPTVLAGVAPGMPAADEEVFGPVAAILEAEDEEDAIRIANDSLFGLGAAVFTADVAKGERIAHTRLEAGSCFVNDFVRSDPRLPFGGIKESGYGRELGELGIHELVNVKTVYVAAATVAPGAPSTE